MRGDRAGRGAVHAVPRVALMTASVRAREIAIQRGLRFYVPKPFRGDDVLDTAEDRSLRLVRTRRIT